jgi:hypothetical protein
MAVYDNVFRPFGWINSYFQTRAKSHHDEVELRGEVYRRNDQGAHQLIPRDAGSEEERPTYQPSQFSISRKPTGYSQSSVNTPDREDPYEQISPGYPYRQPRRGSHYGSLRIWWTELLCCVLFIGAFVAIVLTIRPYEGRPLPQWPY